RVRAVGAIEYDFAKGGGLGERADLCFAANRPKPLLAGLAFGGARSHHDLMAELNKFGSDGIAHHAGAQDCNLHLFPPYRGFSCPARGPKIIARRGLGPILRWCAIHASKLSSRYGTPPHALFRGRSRREKLHAGGGALAFGSTLSEPADS